MANTKVIRSAVPVYIAAVVFILYGLIFPLYSAGHILVALALSVAGYFAAGLLFKGKVVEAELKWDAGDAQVNRQLQESYDALKRIREANDAIPSEEISDDLDRMEAAGIKILAAVNDKPARASQVRRFMNYYLPTTTKLLDQYRKLTDAGGQGEQVRRALTSVEASLGIIAAAFEKELDNLYRDEVVDITSDIEVLEKMMASDGLTNSEELMMKGDH